MVRIHPPQLENMRSNIRDMHVEYDRLEADLEENLTEGEFYFWTQQKRAQNLAHREMGHQQFCLTCRNCLCNKPKRFECICSAGKIWVTPYKIRRRPVYRGQWG